MVHLMAQSEEKLAAKRRRRSLWLLLVLLAIIFTGIFLFRNIGKWLVVNEPLEKARAIVVLSGGLPARAFEAASLYRAGYAQEVWVTKPSEPADSMRELGVPYQGEEEFSRSVLVSQGVPTSAIHVLIPSISNTADEVQVISKQLAEAGGGTVIIITTKAHTRRVRTLWNKLPPGHGTMIVRAAKTDSFDPGHWWRNTRDALDVVREMLGLLNAWAGLPLHAAR